MGMAAAAADKSKRLPKELQDYKREIKKLPFKDRIKAYFDCSPFSNDQDGQKMDIILSTFSKSEREEYYRLYQPIYSAIDRYGDRIRAINRTRYIYENFLDTTLRQRDVINYTADFLNLVLPKVRKALEETKEENTKETLLGAIRTIGSYRRTSQVFPEIKMSDSGIYEVIIKEEEENYLKEVLETIKGILCLLKSYLEALKEFLDWVGTPELFPIEFKRIESDLLSRYQNFTPAKRRDENPDADKFPLFFSRNKIAEELSSIDYKELPRSINIFGEKNLFANAYRSFFNY